MSQRHRSQDVAPPPKMDLRAHAHNERHRIHSALTSVTAQVSSGYEPDEVHEPGRAWVPAHHHDADKVKSQVAPSRSRHWKMKMWKRRTKQRQAKAQAFFLLTDQP